jgi:uncharacterized damage-inducible protein DinB
MEAWMSSRASVILASAFALTITSSAFAQQGGGRGNMPGRGGNMPAPAASTTLAGDFAKDFADQEDLILKAADAMPTDKFDFKPTAPQQTFGERLMHVVMVNGGLLRALGGKTPAPMINMQAKSKADVMMALKQSFDWGLATVKEFSDQQMVERVMPPRFMGPSASRVRIIAFSLVHTEDIYGQMVVYLRLNGVTPPASAAP